MSIIGGRRDQHGCITSAGYIWCESSQSCIRPWETECPSSPSSTEGIIVPTFHGYSHGGSAHGSIVPERPTFHGYSHGGSAHGSIVPERPTFHGYSHGGSAHGSIVPQKPSIHGYSHGGDHGEEPASEIDSSHNWINGSSIQITGSNNKVVVGPSCAGPTPSPDTKQCPWIGNETIDFPASVPCPQLKSCPWLNGNTIRYPVELPCPQVPKPGPIPAGGGHECPWIDGSTITIPDNEPCPPIPPPGPTPAGGGGKGFVACPVPPGEDPLFVRAGTRCPQWKQCMGQNGEGPTWVEADKPCPSSGGGGKGFQWCPDTHDWVAKGTKCPAPGPGGGKGWQHCPVPAGVHPVMVHAGTRCPKWKQCMGQNGEGPTWVEADKPCPSSGGGGKGFQWCPNTQDWVAKGTKCPAPGPGGGKGWQHCPVPAGVHPVMVHAGTRCPQWKQCMGQNGEGPTWVEADKPCPSSGGGGKGFQWCPDVRKWVAKGTKCPAPTPASPGYLTDPLEPPVPVVPQVVQGPVHSACDFGSASYCSSTDHPIKSAWKGFGSGHQTDQQEYDMPTVRGVITPGKFAQYAASKGGHVTLFLGVNPSEEFTI
jgi:hypothetical protein